MAMPPMQISFHEEEDYDPENKVWKYCVAVIIFQSFRKDVQKGSADKRARGKADQAKKNFMQQIPIDGKSKNTHQGYKAD